MKKDTRCPKLLPCLHTFCLSCLKHLENNGTIKCPLCRQPHHIPGGQMEDFPTNHKALEQVLWETKKKIYTLPSSGEAPRIDIGIGFCELQGKPLFTVPYNAIEGTEQRLCETCLNPDCCVIPALDSEEQPGEQSSHRQSQSSLSSTDTSNEAMGRQDNQNGESRNDAASNRQHEVVLLPTSLITLRQTNEGTTNTNISWRTYYASLSKILKRLIFILTFPVIASVGIIISLPTMVVGVLFDLYYMIHLCIKKRDFEYLYFGGCKSTVNFVKMPFKQYAYLITKLFCCGDEEIESRILSMFCRGVAMVVAVVAMSLNHVVMIYVILISLVIYLVIYLLYVGMKKICKKIGKCCGIGSG